MDAGDLDRDFLLFTLAIVGLLWYTILWGIGLLGCMTARKRYRLRPRSPSATAPRETTPGVSILRPLKGLDTNLYENLESTFTQEYPNYEILLSVAEEEDQALPVVRELIAKYPNVNAKVIVGEEVVGVNPKVNNLVKSYRLAANDILWVLDSNITADPGTLARSVDALLRPTPTSGDKRIALVHHVPLAFVNEHKLGSRIEEAFLNTNHAKMYIAINTVAIDSCVVGKSNMYRRSDIEHVNGTLRPVTSKMHGVVPCGLPAFGRFLAEDNMIASALWHELDLRHDLSCDVARNAVGNMSVGDYITRRVRWIRVRKHMVLAATLLEPFTESIILSLIAASSSKYLFGFPMLLFFPLHFAAWLSVDLDVYASLAGFPLPSDRTWGFLVAWAAREVLALPIWVIAMFGSRVEWRGKQYQVLRNGEVEQAGSMNWFDRLRSGRRQGDYERIDLETS
ncbi:hypothetical protein EYR40_003835 [Pleurotus pulmonarius]|nr:hypothetical protein EYR36_007592 [Pleurotus pulmonarius]KAF4605052.1 hypothetical protein EYR40_003835 [Pleurotus pulmonarius]KAF4606545.1 hypothetical protein EYR38_000599 [Pleurotus pulmonarius]